MNEIHPSNSITTDDVSKNDEKGTVAKLAAPALNAAKSAGGFMREHWVGMVIGAASTIAVVAVFAFLRRD